MHKPHPHESRQTLEKARMWCGTARVLALWWALQPGPWLCHILTGELGCVFFFFFLKNLLKPQFPWQSEDNSTNTTELLHELNE